MRHWVVLRLLILGLLIWAIAALAFAPSAHADFAWSAAATTGATRHVQLEARPLFGPGTPATPGWVPYLVTVTNRGGAMVVGAVQLQSRPSSPEQKPYVYAERSVAVVPNGVEHFELPIHDAAVADLQAALFDEEGHLIDLVAAGTTSPSEPLLVDFTQPSRIAAHIAHRPLATRYVPSSFAHYAVPSLAVAELQRDLVDDHLLLPSNAAGYSAATLLLLRSSQLLDLPSNALKGLTGWILGGGSVALVIDRPNDTRASDLIALLGGVAKEKPLDSNTPDTLDLVLGGADSKIRPSEAVMDELVTYTGGNLRPTQWGAAASYGLGELHLLAFDPTSTRQAKDRWLQSKMLSLIGYAWDRSAQVVFPAGQAGLEDPAPRELQQVLDPSRGKLWVIVLAVFLLVAYALLAGPANFFLARRAGNGMRALWRLPVWAAATSTGLVLLGVVSKGGGEHAHRLTLVELGAGATRGAAVRYRALFTDSELLNISASMGLSVFDVLGPREQSPRLLVVDHLGSGVTDLRHRPWQTVLVREDGLVDQGQGIALVGGPQEVTVINRTGHDLVAALLHLPNGDLRFFPRIVMGGRAASGAGELIHAGTDAPTHALHDLDIGESSYRLERDCPGLVDAWKALQVAANREVDWWPADVPVLMAQLDASRSGLDSNLQLDEDRTLLRIVGYGGEP
ncbi:MAG TPA: hypothetical protein VL137_18275 [Polyangiaceae bacterium]|nr:hypothetical protein [Polyangiaceae bacterium]